MVVKKSISTFGLIYAFLTPVNVKKWCRMQSVCTSTYLFIYLFTEYVFIYLLI
jgi:uncharacterized protein YqhQ